MFGGSSRPQSQFLKPAPTKRISLPSSQRLNTILEGGIGNNSTGSAHELSPRILNARHSYLGVPPLADAEKPPPRYSQLNSNVNGGFSLSVDPDLRGSDLDHAGTVGAGMSPLERLRGQLTARGGWKKMVLIAVIVLLIIVGLVVGLAVGLTGERHGGSSGSGSAGAGISGNTAPSGGGQSFPLGVWDFDVVLASANTSCASNPNTWTCFPYVTVGTSTTASQYTFTWNISRAAGEGGQLQIGSSSDIFSLMFPPTPLTLLGQGSSNERYTFSVKVPKEVQPTVAIGEGNSQAVCYFNRTILSATLYTLNMTEVGSDTSPTTWPGSTYVNQFVAGGAGVPSCLNSAGANITQGLGPQPSDSQCSCTYESNNATSSTK